MLFAVVFTSRPIHAEPFRVALRLEVDADLQGCPSEAEFADMVAGRLGTVPFDPAAPVVLRVRFVKSATNVLAQVSLAGEGVSPTVREMEGRECGALASAMALTASLALDPLIASPPAASPPPVAAPAPSPPVASAWSAPVVANPPLAPAVVAQAPPVTRAPRTHTGFHYGLSGQLVSGVLPGTGLAPGIAIPIAWETASGLEAGVELSYFPWQTLTTSDGDVRAMRIQGAALVCYRLWAFFGCGAIGIGPMWGESAMVVEPRDDVSMQGFAAARLGVQLRFAESAELRLSGELVVALTRTTLMLAGEDAWTTPPFAPGLSATLWFGT